MVNKIPPDGSPTARRNWKDDARTAVAELQLVAHGERESEMLAIAKRNGHIDTTALRRAIFAYEFLQRLCVEKPAVYEILLLAPLTIVEVIARWHAFDPSTALSVAKDWGRGIGTVRTIAADMQKVRPLKGRPGNAKAYLTAAEPVVVDAVRSLTDAELSSPKMLVKDSASGQLIDFLLSETNKKKEQFAVLVVGPYTNEKLYANRCSDWITKAFGLAWVYDRVVLALPEKDYLDQYRKRCRLVENKAQDRLPKLPSSSPVAPKVDIVHINVNPFSKEDSEALAALADKDAKNSKS
jgi:hypothetical protein